jgi:hypothetical protein
VIRYSSTHGDTSLVFPAHGGFLYLLLINSSCLRVLSHLGGLVSVALLVIDLRVGGYIHYMISKFVCVLALVCACVVRGRVGVVPRCTCGPRALSLDAHLDLEVMT